MTYVLPKLRDGSSLALPSPVSGVRLRVSWSCDRSAILGLGLSTSAEQWLGSVHSGSCMLPGQTSTLPRADGLPVSLPVTPTPNTGPRMRALGAGPTEPCKLSRRTQ